MEIEILESVPVSMKPLQTYETRYIYTGFGKYDVESQVFSRIELRNSVLLYHEHHTSDGCFSRGYFVENVRVTVYSRSPRIWAEELSPDKVYFFREKQGQQDD